MRVSECRKFVRMDLKDCRSAFRVHWWSRVEGTVRAQCCNAREGATQAGEMLAKLAYQGVAHSADLATPSSKDKVAIHARALYPIADPNRCDFTSTWMARWRQLKQLICVIGIPRRVLLVRHTLVWPLCTLPSHDMPIEIGLFFST